MNRQDLVSIVITAFNAREHIERSVLSTLRQTYENLDIVVVSDDLVDYRSVLKGKNIDDVRIRFLSTNLYGSGGVNAVNLGIDKAQSNYVAILDFDDEFYPEKIEKMLPLVKKYGAATSAMEFREDSTGKEIENLSLKCNGDSIRFPEFIMANIHSYSNIFFDKSKISSRFYKGVDYCGDILFAASMYDYIDLCGYDPSILQRYYRREGSMCNSEGAVENFIEAYGKILKLLDDSDFFIKDKSSIKLLRTFFSEMLKVENEYLAEINRDKSQKFSDTLKRILPTFSKKIFEFV